MMWINQAALILLIVMLFGGAAAFNIWLFYTIIRAFQSVIEMNDRLKRIETKLNTIASQGAK